jgi:hypothetical protein
MRQAGLLGIEPIARHASLPPRAEAVRGRRVLDVGQVDQRVTGGTLAHRSIIPRRRFGVHVKSTI